VRIKAGLALGLRLTEPTSERPVTNSPADAAAIGGKLVAGKKINLTGVRAPEECVKGDNYNSMLDELKLSDIHIQEKVSWQA
jgi:hypothetical protein